MAIRQLVKSFYGKFFSNHELSSDGSNSKFRRQKRLRRITIKIKHMLLYPNDFIGDFHAIPICMYQPVL